MPKFKPGDILIRKDIDDDGETRRTFYLEIQITSYEYGTHYNYTALRDEDIDVQKKFGYKVTEISHTFEDIDRAYEIKVNPNRVWYHINDF